MDPGTDTTNQEAGDESADEGPHAGPDRYRRRLRSALLRIDITTVGRRTGVPRRIEIWFHRVDGRWYLTGMPVPRSWYANLRADPRLIVHLKHGVTADLPATARPVDEPTRRRVITAVLDLQNRPEIAARVSRRQNLDDWLARSPLVEIVFEDEQFAGGTIRTPFKRHGSDRGQGPASERQAGR
ncbi:nitroreductase/quinone reductase family protein [Nonomuraea jiangxiensis]|uniref:Deazaflavin-dependent oxidoreductase, nitroreductase family n=1 Tax=Nonomuraea jiangxiensis TaxID=633440 RepID=A0A1G8QGZ2_9ACTN|nr:nitroreductase/quinone reductase family protein [Nonomuraea jiangxiensis]SDJ03866.1 deazaflavin-dependent oxidoreductase, nitroreductase family [Nonomuraea jiangxiensis]